MELFLGRKSTSCKDVQQSGRACVEGVSGQNRSKEDYGKGNVLGGVRVALKCQGCAESFSHTFP